MRFVNHNERDPELFNLTKPRVRISDSDLLESLQQYAEKVGGRAFPTTEYNRWPRRRAGAETFTERFGSWRRALKLIGIQGSRERRYSNADLVDNLEGIWRQLGHAPGKRQIAKLGLKISEGPYRTRWGSLKTACEAVAKFHAGKIDRERLVAGPPSNRGRSPLPQKLRWEVLKRDSFRCVQCGVLPADDRTITLEVDHILAVARGGADAIANLQTLCNRCNGGKSSQLQD